MSGQDEQKKGARRGGLTGPRAVGAGLAISRRQFLAWGTALGACTALPIAWMGESPLRVGLLGLGRRGLQALAICRDVPGVEIAGLCDRREEALREALGRAMAKVPLATGDARRLFAAGTLDAVVIAAAADCQLELAGAACRAGKHVLLLQPLSLSAAGLQALEGLAALAARRGVQVQVARSTRLALDPATARSLVGGNLGEGDIRTAAVQAELYGRRSADDDAFFSELIDEIDFAHSMLGGKALRRFAVGGPGLVPGRWLDRRIHFELGDENGTRRTLTLSLLAKSGSLAHKSSRLVLQGPGGSAHFTGSLLASPDPADLHLFLDAVRCRNAGAGLSVARLHEIAELWAGVTGGGRQRFEAAL